MFNGVVPPEKSSRGRKIFFGGAWGFSGKKNRGEFRLAPAFPGNSYGEKPCLYFAVLRRRRTTAATPEMPVPSRIIVAGSGTVDCEPVNPAVRLAVWPDCTNRLANVNVKEPVVVPSLNVNTVPPAGWLKVMKTPPSFGAGATLPVTVAV